MSGRAGAGDRVLPFLLGAWLAFSVAMAFVASGNFHVVEPANLRHSDEVYSALPEGEPRRTALRYVASELNRFFFAKYDVANLVLAVACTWLVLRGPRRPKSLAAMLVCLAVSIAFTTWFTPTIIEMGRQIDFVPRDPRPPEVAAFYRLHGLNIGLEMLKMVLILGVTAGLVRGSRD